MARGFQVAAFQTDFQQQPDQTSAPPNLIYGQNTGTPTFDESAYWHGAASYAIAPALPGGVWNFNTATGLLTIDTTSLGTFGPYTITATNADGSTAGSSFTVDVQVITGWPGLGAGWRRRRHFYS